MGGVQILHDIIICKDNASECLLYVRTAPQIVQIPAFLFSRDALLKCDSLDSADFQMFRSDIGIKLNYMLSDEELETILLANSKF